MDDWYRITHLSIQEFYTSSQDFVTFLSEKQARFQYICIWGVGNLGRPTAAAFKAYGLQVDFYCDNDRSKWGKEYDGIMCLSVNELLEIKENTLVIICARAYKEIYKQLTALGCPHIDRVFILK